MGSLAVHGEKAVTAVILLSAENHCLTRNRITSLATPYMDVRIGNSTLITMNRGLAPYRTRTTNYLAHNRVNVQSSHEDVWGMSSR